MHNFAGSIILLTNPDQELHKLELTFRNIVLDKKGNPTQVGTPLMNDEGVRSVIGQVQSIVSQVTVMSNLDDEVRDSLRDFLADTIAKDLMLNRAKYQIENASARDRIFMEAIAMAIITMNRAANEGERKFWKGSQQEIITHGNMPGGAKGGLLTRALGWGGK
ncbi:MAG: hypothetical protein DRR04_05330 [Gammaproteobacteria bacterium]|nr:MAG: hypothetical protein DRQ97_06740 [Gammaproteobacteria bacterium]RLA60550.1 MAG: hypothetical protein DRR04_05330 [Gammaproteobacteria bacterium]